MYISSLNIYTFWSMEKEIKLEKAKKVLSAINKNRLTISCAIRTVLFVEYNSLASNDLDWMRWALAVWPLFRSFDNILQKADYLVSLSRWYNYSENRIIVGINWYISALQCRIKDITKNKRLYWEQYESLVGLLSKKIKKWEIIVKEIKSKSNYRKD